jgi:hypothetical protein
VNWYAAPTPARRPLAPCSSRESQLGGQRTEEGNYTSGAGDDTHGADVLLAERVLDGGNDGADGGGLDHGAPRVGEGIARVVGRVLVGHGGQNGRR